VTEDLGGIAAKLSEFRSDPVGFAEWAFVWGEDEHPHVRPASLVVEPGGTSVSTHGLGYLFTALRRQGLIADEFLLQLTTFLRSLDLFLELIVLTRSPLTANQVRHGGKQGTHNPDVLTSLPRSLRPKD
jgi:hypothetical protein